MTGARRPLVAAAALAGRYGGGLLIAETLAAGLVHGRTLFFGTPANVGRHPAIAADDLGIAVHVITGVADDQGTGAR